MCCSTLFNFYVFLVIINHVYILFTLIMLRTVFVLCMSLMSSFFFFFSLSFIPMWFILGYTFVFSNCFTFCIYDDCSFEERLYEKIRDNTTVVKNRSISFFCCCACCIRTFRTKIIHPIVTVCQHTSDLFPVFSTMEDFSSHLNVLHLDRTHSSASTDSTVTSLSTMDDSSNENEDGSEQDFSSFDPNGEIDEHEILGEVDESDIFQLVFCSSSVSPALSKSDMADIIEVCRTRNAADAISGLLMYKDGQFVQVLEGSEPRVRRTFSRIRKDRRHHAVYVLLEQKTKHRDFPRWPMAFRDMTWTDSVPPTPEATLLDENGEVVKPITDPINKLTVADSTASQLFTEDMNPKTKTLVVLYHKLYMRI